MLNPRIAGPVVAFLNNSKLARDVAIKSASALGSERSKRFLTANELHPSSLKIETPYGSFQMEIGHPLDLVAKMVTTQGPMSFEAPLPAITARMASAISPETSVVVGASTGYYVMLIALASKQSVRAYEPFPAARRRLHSNIQMSGLTGQIFVSPAAASSDAGEGTLHVPDYETDNWPLESSASLDPTFKSVKTNAVTVDVVRLDDDVQDKVGLLFVDAEGMDVHVLRGATRILREQRPYVALEMTEAEIPQLETLLSDCDYDSYEITARGLLLQHEVHVAATCSPVDNSESRSSYWSLVLCPRERSSELVRLLAKDKIPVDK